METELVED